MTIDPHPLSSAGTCRACGRDVDKRYGGQGRYVAMCLDCWTDPYVDDDGRRMVAAEHPETRGTQ